jgi:hypothetical protein
MRQLGAAFGVAIPAAVFAATGSYASAGAFSDGFGPAMGVAAVLSLGGAAAALVLPRQRAATRLAPARSLPGVVESAAASGHGADR